MLLMFCGALSAGQRETAHNAESAKRHRGKIAGTGAAARFWKAFLAANPERFGCASPAGRTSPVFRLRAAAGGSGNGGSLW